MNGKLTRTGPSMHGLCCVSEADAVLEWIYGLAHDAAVLDHDIDMQIKACSYIIIKTVISVPPITGIHHCLGTLLLWRIRLLEPALCQEQSWRACRESSERIRAAGSWKAAIRRPHIELLVLRALVVRGRARTRDGGGTGLRRYVTLPKPLLWRVLNYWRATHLPDKFELGLCSAKPNHSPAGGYVHPPLPLLNNNIV